VFISTNITRMNDYTAVDTYRGVGVVFSQNM